MGCIFFESYHRNHSCAATRLRDLKGFGLSINGDMLLPITSLVSLLFAEKILTLLQFRQVAAKIRTMATEFAQVFQPSHENH